MNNRSLGLAFSMIVLTACGGTDRERDELPSAGDRGGGSTSAGGNTTGGNNTDYGIPAEYPQLNARYAAHGVWSRDSSGAEVIPNRWVASIDELHVAEGVETFGAIWDPNYGSYAIEMQDTDDDQFIQILLPALEPGDYEVTGFNGEINYRERGHYTYTSRISGGRGTVRIEGKNEKALWGTFEGRFCFVQTPDANCFSFYAGRFAAADQGGGARQSGGPTVPGGPGR